MIQVILYRIDRAGQLDLAECTIPDISLLAEFFVSDRGTGWEWAEVEDPRQRHTRRYNADELRAMTINPIPEVGLGDVSPS